MKTKSFNKTSALPLDNSSEGGDVEPQQEIDSDLKRQILRWFYDRLTLNEADRKSLFDKRGLTDATIDALGFRSNPKSNEDILLELPKHFPMNAILQSGLWKADPSNLEVGAKPDPQFCGKSLVEKRDYKGRKVRDSHGKVIIEYIWNHPILIPYINAAGELIHLRPHKGMMAGKSPRFYGIWAKYPNTIRPEFSQLPPRQQAIITEGEFKAAALWQALGDTTAVGALPGITMAKPLMGEVEEWLEACCIREVVVAYDNENKADETLPGYQREKYRRFEVHIWARYLARQLSKQGYSGKVCVLPDAWRDAKGKADWDGRLAYLMKTMGVSDGSSVSWGKIRRQVRQEFENVIFGSKTIGEHSHASFFDTETERIIRNQLDKISHEPCLPIGGTEEQKLAQRFFRLAAELKQKDWVKSRDVGFIIMLARAFQATSDRYYRMKPLSEKQEELWRENQEESRRRGDDEFKRACDLVLRGRKSLKATRRGHIPETISDFYFEPLYVLRRSNGTRIRVLAIHSVHSNKIPTVEIPWDEWGSPTKLRDCLNRCTTGSSWDGGQSELTALHEDLGHALAFKEIIEVPVRGYHTQSKIWFFEDWAINDEGEFTPDPKTKIFWIKHKDGVQGYTFARNANGRPIDREDETFRQGVPCMHPDIKDNKESVVTLFKDVLQKLPEAVGQIEAYMALGMIFSPAAGPEIYQEWNCYPGLWVHGAQGEGKSTLVRWMTRVWGFPKETGLPLPADDHRSTLTMAALSGALGQYGECPLWLDEYQVTAPSWVLAIFKNAFDRAEGAKKDFGSSPREFLSSIIVSGVATSSDPQTRSRFAHIHVTSKNRTASHFEWFQTNSRKFYQLGRLVLRHRQQFVASLLTALRAWEKIDSLKDLDARARMVHGLAYAGLHAVCEVFDVAIDWSAYRKALIEHCKKSASDVKEQGVSDLFWRELLNLFDAGAFGRSRSDLQRIFHVIEEKRLRADISPHQLKAGADESYKAWKSYLLYFKSGSVLELMRSAKRRSGGDLPFTQSDLQNHMKTRDYWHPAKHASGHRQKFGGKSSAACWCIRVDQHELGYQRVSDEEFEASFVQDSESNKFLASDSWIDPRKGDLFELINILLGKGDSEEN